MDAMVVIFERFSGLTEILVVGRDEGPRQGGRHLLLVHHWWVSAYENKIFYKVTSIEREVSLVLICSIMSIGQ